MNRRYDAQRHRQEQREYQTRQCQLQRCRQPVEQQRHGRRLPLVGLSEVAHERIADEHDELEWQRLVEPEGLAHGGELFLARVHRQHQRDGVARKTLRNEDDQQRPDNGDNALHQSAEDVALQGCALRMPRIDRQNAPGHGAKSILSRQASVIMGR